MMVLDQNELQTLTGALRCSRQRASKGDGPTAAAGPFILRGSLCSRLRMTVRNGRPQMVH